MPKACICLTTLLILIFGCSHAKEESEDFPVLNGSYFDQKPPGKTPERFAPDIFDSLYSFMNSVIIFSPDGKEAFWQARLRPEKPNVLGGAWIFESKYLDGSWTQPKPASFSLENMGDDCPFISPDGKKLFFLSKRPIRKAANGSKIWVMDKTEAGWSEQRPLPPHVNGLNIRGQFSVDRQGNIYFTVWNTIPRYTELDIYWTRFLKGQYSNPEKLGPEINKPAPDSYSESPFIAPDGSYLIFTIRTNENCRLFISYKEKNGFWTQARDLSDIIGENMNCSNPFVTFDEKYLFFLKLSEMNGDYPEGYEWIDAKFIEELRPAEMR